MSNPFQSFFGSTIPVLAWKFFEGERDAAKHFNSTTWEGWQPEWTAIATNGMGDAIVVHEGSVYEVEHGTGCPAQLGKPLSTDVNALVTLLKELQPFVECSEDDSLIELRQKRDQLQRLKKLSPRQLKHHFDDALADAKDRIEDARWKQTPAGRLQASVEANHRAWEESIQNRWEVADLKIRRSGELEVGVAGIAKADDIAAIVQYVSELVGSPVRSLLKPRSDPPPSASGKT